MQIVLFLHNLLRWGVLVFGLWAVVQSLIGWSGHRSFTKSSDKAGLLFMIFCDIQLLIGLALYFGNEWFTQLKEGGAEVMKNAGLRFFAMEHALMMIIAWILVHVGRVAVKKAALTSKHKRAFIFYGLALIIILATIPWPFRTEIARPFFRGI